MQQLVQRTLEANRQHQYHLTKYAERLQEQIAEVDRLLADAVIHEDDADDGIVSTVVIEGSKKATGPVSSAELLSPESPFFEESKRRMRRINELSAHPMKEKEVQALIAAVKAERIRVEAINLKSRDASQPATTPDNQDENLNWEVIAEKVSDSSSTKRSAVDCKVIWLGDKNPEINHSEWKEDEVNALKRIVASETEQVDWVKVAKTLGTRRLPMDCLRHSLDRRIMWTVELDQKLRHAVDLYGTDNWNFVARHVSEDATAQACEVRYARTIATTLKRGGWSEEEDERLRLAVAGYGESWVEIASAIPGRVNDQCRDRWKEIKTSPIATVAAAPYAKWTSEEDAKLSDAVNTHGSQWKTIALLFGGRWTDKQCRKRYQTLRKRLAAQPQNSQQEDGRLVSLRFQPEITTSTAFVEQSARPRPIPRPTNARVDAEFTAKRKDVHPIEIGREAKRSKTDIAEGEHADSLEMERADESSSVQPRRSSRLRKTPAL